MWLTLKQADEIIMEYSKYIRCLVENLSGYLDDAKTAFNFDGRNGVRGLHNLIREGRALRSCIGFTINVRQSELSR